MFLIDKDYIIANEINKLLYLNFQDFLTIYKYGRKYRYKYLFVRRIFNC